MLATVVLAAAEVDSEVNSEWDVRLRDTDTVGYIQKSKIEQIG